MALELLNSPGVSSGVVGEVIDLAIDAVDGGVAQAGVAVSASSSAAGVALASAVRLVSRGGPSLLSPAGFDAPAVVPGTSDPLGASVGRWYEANSAGASIARDLYLDNGAGGTTVAAGETLGARVVVRYGGTGAGARAHFALYFYDVDEGVMRAWFTLSGAGAVLSADAGIAAYIRSLGDGFYQLRIRRVIEAARPMVIGVQPSASSIVGSPSSTFSTSTATQADAVYVEVGTAEIERAAIATTAVGGPALASPSAMTLSSPGGTDPFGVTLGRWTETTANAQHAVYINNGSGAFAAVAGETVGATAVVSLTGAGRKFVALFFYDATNGNRQVWFDLVAGTVHLADAGVTGIIEVLAGFARLKIRATYAAAATIAAGLKTSNSTSGTPVDSFAGSTSVYLSVGTAATERLLTVATPASGRVASRVQLIGAGTATITSSAPGAASGTASVVVAATGGGSPILSGSDTLPSLTASSGGATLSGSDVLPSLVAGTGGATLSGSDVLPALTASSGGATLSGSDVLPVLRASADQGLAGGWARFLRT